MNESEDDIFVEESSGNEEDDDLSDTDLWVISQKIYLILILIPLSRVQVNITESARDSLLEIF